MDTIALDASKFNASMARFIDKLGLEAPRVVRQEAGELMKTLVRVTPPDDPTRTRESIKTGITSKFEQVNDQSDRYFRHKSGNAGVTWYAWTSKFLYGVEQQKDMRDASADEVYKVAKTLTAHGRQRLPFKFPRSEQKVLLSQTILTKQSTVNQVIKRLQNHVGRLKAGWLVGWDALNPSGSNMPPAWVMKHKAGAQGRFVDELGKKDFPSVSIANSATGIKAPKAQYLAQKALDIRAGAMLTNFRLFFKGKKQLSDY